MVFVKETRVESNAVWVEIEIKKYIEITKQCDTVHPQLNNILNNIIFVKNSVYFENINNIPASVLLLANQNLSNGSSIFVCFFCMNLKSYKVRKVAELDF